MSTEERLAKLELDLATAKRRMRWLLAAAVMAGAGLVLAWGRTKSVSIAHAEEAGGGAVRNVRAQGFTLVDENGKVRAELRSSKDGPELLFFDENGKGRAWLSVGKEGAALRLSDADGKSRLVLGVTPDGPGLGLSDENGKARAGLVVGKRDGPIFNLCDENGKPRAGLTVTRDGPKIEFYYENGRVCGAMGAVPEGTALGLSDLDGKPRASMVVTRAGAILGLYDQNGRAVWQAPR